MKRAIALCALAACASSGSSSRGPHPLDYSPGPQDTYVRNPQVKLAHEYWVIFETEGGRHYMLPRPDGSPDIATECGRGTELGVLFQGAHLCNTARSQADVQRVNSLTLDEARKASTFLHERLRFAAEGDQSIRPHPLRSDMREICKVYPTERASVLKNRCDRELDENRPAAASKVGRAEPRTSEEAHPFNAAELKVVPSLLNQYYGITS